MQIKCFEKHSELFAIRPTTTQITNNKLEQWEISDMKISNVFNKSDHIILVKTWIFFVLHFIKFNS